MLALSFDSHVLRCGRSPHLFSSYVTRMCCSHDIVFHWLIIEQGASNGVIGGVCATHLVSFMCCRVMCLYVLTSVLSCPIMCLYVLTSVLWCPIMCPYVLTYVLWCPIMCLYVLTSVLWCPIMCLCVLTSVLWCPIMCLCVQTSVLCCPIMCLYVLTSVLWCPLWFPHKNVCSVRLCLQLFVGRLMSYLLYLCLLGHSGIQHILCCAFALFVFVLCLGVASFSGLSILHYSFGILWRLFTTRILTASVGDS